MKNKCYITDRINGVWFRTPEQLKEYYNRMVGSDTHYGKITEVERKEIHPSWKECTL